MTAKPTTPVTIRLATEADAAALQAVDAVSWDASSGFPSMRDREAAEFFNERATPDRHLVAEYEGRVVGYLRLLPKTPILENAHVYGIWGFAVHPDARGLGIGSALMDAAEKAAREHGARKIGLHVFATNTTARRLYEKHGYVQEGCQKDELYIEGRYVDDLLLAKFL